MLADGEAGCIIGATEGFTDGVTLGMGVLKGVGLVGTSGVIGDVDGIWELPTSPPKLMRPGPELAGGWVGTLDAVEVPVSERFWTSGHLETLQFYYSNLNNCYVGVSNK